MTKEELEAAGLTPEIIKKIGLAIEQGCDEETQREMHGDATVDWVKEAHSHIEFEGPGLPGQAQLDFRPVWRRD